jgi:hypothetical protein
MGALEHRQRGGVQGGEVGGTSCLRRGTGPMRPALMIHIVNPRN